MQKNYTYLIKWYGPFTSKESLKEWEDERLEVFNLYVFQAKRKGRKDNYYCGMTYKQTVGERLRNHDHHIHDFEDERTETLQIWIGTIANIKAKKKDVLLCENIITSELARIGVGEKHLENKTNKKPPVHKVFIINEWWKKDEEDVKKCPKKSVPSVILDVMAYYSETNALYGINKLKYIGDLL